MKFLKKLRDQIERDKSAIRTSNAHLDQAVRAEPEAEREHSAAVEQLKSASEMQRKLEEANRRNHFSESLTLAFRERPAP